ncbi:hypothetical protein CLV58_109253 [Spirosoma oryzae]|uniref:Uncharacterized protein n=1 Tax=Spirosoma oryzae TaxID=1469603 RepID=A0A2T0SYN8_9BACT|nr:hypothetical protein [Spirosoma oryzae]PRY38526.1 hypothetical protein CLV58_109253 [Spirosoma oryzae]
MEKRYVITWQIVEEGETPQEAAEQALSYFHDNSTICFSVEEDMPNSEATEVILDL